MTNDYKDLIEAIETRTYSYKLEYKGDNLKLVISLYKTNWLGNYKGIEFGLKELRTVELLSVKQNLLHKKHQKETSKIAIINCILEEIDEILRNRPEDIARISSLLE